MGPHTSTAVGPVLIPGQMGPANCTVQKKKKSARLTPLITLYLETFARGLYQPMIDTR